MACSLGGERGFSTISHPVRLPDASRQAPIGYAVAVSKPDDFSFRKSQSVSCCFFSFRKVEGEW
jgi:hypothetical protein